MIFKGTYTALVTPFRKDALDLDALEFLLMRQAESSVDGIVLIGTTAESPTLTEDEETQIIETAHRVVRGRKPLIVGTGTNSTKKTVEKSKRAKALGADAVMLVNPYYNCPTQEGLFQHFIFVAESVDVPILLYNHFKRTGVQIEPRLVRRLAEHPNIVGIKDASSDWHHLRTLIEEKPEGFAVLTANDDMTKNLVNSGGDGVISVASNLVPDLMSDLSQHEILRPLFKALASETNPIPIKTALHLVGWIEEELRLPLTRMDLENREILKKTLKSLNLKEEKIYSQA